MTIPIKMQFVLIVCFLPTSLKNFTKIYYICCCWKFTAKFTITICFQRNEELKLKKHGDEKLTTTMV